MQKIKETLIKKMYRYNLSRLSFVTLLDLLNFADEKGKVEIYYKDMVDLIECSKAQFYNVIHDLEDVGLISISEKEYYKNEIHIKINDNDFSNGYCNYVDTNKIFFTNRMYADLKAGEIRTYLYFIFRITKQKYDVDHTKNKLFFGSSIKAIADQLKMTKRMVSHYCKKLKDRKLICIAKDKVDKYNKKYDVITVNKEKMDKPVIKTKEKGKEVTLAAKPLLLSWKHYVKNLCRRHNKTFDDSNVTDTAMLINQYQNKATQEEKDIYSVLNNAVLNCRDNILNSKVVHCIMRELLKKDYREGNRTLT